MNLIIIVVILNKQFLGLLTKDGKNPDEIWHSLYTCELSGQILEPKIGSNHDDHIKFLRDEFN